MYALSLSYLDKNYALHHYYVVTTTDEHLIDVIHSWLSSYNDSDSNSARALCKAFGSVVNALVRGACTITGIYIDSVPEYKEFDLERQLNDNIVFLFFRDGTIEISLGPFKAFMTQEEFLATHNPPGDTKENVTMLPGSLYFDIRGNE